MASVNTILFVCVLSFLSLLTVCHAVRYDPTWDSLDKRPNPAWYDESKIGIFLHWGVFSVPSLLSEWFWMQWKGEKNKRAIEYMSANYKPDFTYADFAKDFDVDLFDPNEWADIFNASGAQMCTGYKLPLYLLFVTFMGLSAQYAPNWASLDTRPLPNWYDEGKIGIFVVWGLYAVPALQNEWFWEMWHDQHNEEIVKYMEDNYKPNFTYQDFAAEFTADLFDPEDWADIFNASGAKYIVLTSKHHEGYTNWPSKYSFSWNSMDVGPHRDLVGDLASAIRSKTNIHFGLYHSLFEWFHPLYLRDKANKWKTNEFVTSKTMPELYELVNTYKPDVIWSDGDWEAPDTYWNSTEFIAWLYNDSPVKDTIVTNDRWGNGVMCHHGGFLTCSDRYNPGVLQKRKWENAMTVDRQSWGYRRDATLKDMLTMESLLATLASTVSCGGNMLINVGPTKDGRIIPLFEERLRALGVWLQLNGQAIYGTKPWTHQNDTIAKNVWYTSKKNTDGGVDVYAILLNFPDPGQFVLGAPNATPDTKVTLLGYSDPLTWKGSKGISIDIPAIPFNRMPCQYAWVLKLTNLF